MTFSSLALSPALLRALSSKGYVTPTPIQRAAIPAAIAGRDVLGWAQTGSGKTLAFVLPLLQRLQKHTPSDRRKVRALVLVPTRELAAQVAETFREFAAHLPHSPRVSSAIKVTVVFGGVSINPQMLGLRGGTDLVVATPGRLLDLIDRNALTLGDVETLVLDEADRLLELGFQAEAQRILSLLPAQRQHLCFSATFPSAVISLTDTLLSNPVRVVIEASPHTTPDVTQRAIMVDGARRTQLLRHLIESNRWQRVLVFAATKHACEIIAEKLRKARINAEPFHGELSQGKRTQVLADFTASRLQVVVATDVASRGIDIADMPVVVNFDLPRSADDYTHRIGRTARAGASGLAVSFVSASTEPHFWLIRKRQGLALPIEEIAGFEPTERSAAISTNHNGGVKGRRPSKKDKLRAAALAG